MRRLLPSSLLGQVMLAVAFALLVAQIISAALIYSAGEERRINRVAQGVSFRLVGDPAFGEPIGEFQGVFRERGRRGGRPMPMLRGELTDVDPLLPDEVSNARWVEEIEENLTPHRLDPYQIVAVRRDAFDDPTLMQRMRAWGPRRRQVLENNPILVAALQVEEGGPWRVVRVWYPRVDRAAIALTMTYTLGLFVLLITVLYFILRRITRPLARLTDRVGDFAANPDRAVRLEETGPSDTRRLIAAHNAMEARIAAMLDEKDVMLGAIGHDLKTPLAALRVRIESVPDEAQRAKMANSIEDITQTLDDILILSRVGRDRSGAEAVDLGALMSSVTEEFEDLGESVSMNDPSRLVATIQVTWVKRALRNLVSNAVRYGGGAELSLFEEDGLAILRIDDNGPGIAPDQIATMLEPFARGEASRNRSTGGAGLGLTIARAIAEQHGGELTLSNRAKGGLRAEIKLPLSPE